MGKQFGGKITEEELKRYQQSTNWRNGSFQNLEETSMDLGLAKIPSVIYKQIKGPAEGQPARPIPVEDFDKEAFLDDSNGANFIWYGHSVLLIRLNGKTVLIDPMLGPDASPIAPFKTKRFSKDTLDLIDQFPEIDFLLMTHDHYDHLDLASINKLKSKTKKYLVALGVKRHLKAWDIDPEKVVEFDWWDSRTEEGIEFHFTPSRHFSGRGLNDRAKCLWGGWVLKSANQSIWFSGDGGYGKHFQEIGKRLGPFDIGFMECGQYSEDWALIHMFPHEAVQAAIDGGAKTAVPVHWGGFKLTYAHSWFEPAKIFREKGNEFGLKILTPRIGELFSPDSESTDEWWEKYRP